MKIIFMGTSEFAIPSLKMLAENFEISAVLTRPDRPKGRGQQTETTPVKKIALEKKIPIYAPEILKNNPEILKILSHKPDLIVVVAYGLFLPPEILNLPRLGCVNLHASLLPKYRGAAPIQWAILNAEKITGVSIIFINEKMDCGDIIAEKKLEILPEETAGKLEERLAVVGAELLKETLPKIEKDQIQRKKQDESLATLAPRIKKEDTAINWDEPAEKIKNKIRAFNSKPGAFSFINGKYLKIWAAAVSNEKAPAEAAIGAIVKISQEETLVKTRDGCLNLKEIQPEAGKKMTPHQYALGHPLKVGDVFENQ